MRTFEEIQADTRNAISRNDVDAILRFVAELDLVGTPVAEAEAGNARGWIFNLHSNFTAAMEQHDHALTLFEQLGDRGGMARVLGSIGLVHKNIGDYTAAMDHHLRSLALYEELGDKGGMATATGNIGIVHMSTGEYPAALDHYHRALALHEELGNRNGVAGTTCNIGAVHMSTGDFPAALEHFHRALVLCEELGNRHFAANITGNIGSVHINTGNYPAALDHCNRALALFLALDDRNAVATATSGIGNAYRISGDHAAALEHHQRALALHEELGSRSGMAISMDGILAAHVGMGNDAEAQTILQALDAMQIEEPWVRIDRDLQRATLQQRSGDLDGAIATLQHALAEAQQHGLRVEEASAHKHLRDLALAQNNLAAYVEHNNEHTRITEEINGKETALRMAMQAKQREIDAERKEHEKHIAILHSTLPKHVAERVARGEVINDHFDNATVIFLDIVGFTELSSSMSSQEVIELLDDVFTQCDAICAQHGVTKIKTIGDSYMCVSFDNAVNAALCALDMSRIRLSHAVSHKVSHEVLFRIGMHCGPVTAGVIGKERMQYDVWGDTVNVASRMESAGEPGKVHVSEALASELKSNTEYTIQNAIKQSRNQGSHAVPLVTGNLSLVTTFRGMIDIKGKGPMRTYWLESTT